MKAIKSIQIRISKTLASCVALLSLFLGGCDSFLEEKPDKGLAIPTSIKDLQAILDARTNNESYPVSGAMAVDDYYLSSTDWNALADMNVRLNYIWEKDDSDMADWRSSYRTVFNANVVIDHLDKVTYDDVAELRAIEGSARFFRAFALFHLSQIFTQPLRPDPTAEGLPLRLSADINLPTVRSTLAETYNFIVDELLLAVDLLPLHVGKYKVRPSKAAAYSMLARVYLIMEEYEHAARFADLALSQNISLLDYALLDHEQNNPFSLFNDEVIFHATTAWGATLMPSICKIDTMLYRLYEEGDYRKSLYFETNSDGSVAFKGHYHGQSVGSLFVGLAADEVYLISAEANARMGNLLESKRWMEVLLLNRYRDVPSLTDLSTEELLGFILLERRKQLLMRGDLRWSDLRRFNWNKTDMSFDIIRNLDGEEYRLSPTDLRYTFLIPQRVIQESGIDQNPR